MFVFGHLGQVTLLFAVLVAAKFVLAGLSMAVTGYTLRIAILSGAGLAQIGEFSFVILKMGLDAKLVSNDLYNLFLSFVAHDNGHHAIPPARDAVADKHPIRVQTAILASLRAKATRTWRRSSLPCRSM